MSKVQELVNKNLNKASKAETEETTRFMLVINEETREELRSLCEAMGVKQISFASELFTIALTEAVTTYKAAQKPANQPK